LIEVPKSLLTNSSSCAQHCFFKAILLTIFRKDNSTHRLSFVNMDFLAASLCDDAERIKIQPSFVFAGLALAQLLRSSSAEQGLIGMEKAIRLRDQAKEAIDQAQRAGLLHADLAKAQYVSFILSCLQVN
jgi:hypothetical protein